MATASVSLSLSDVSAGREHDKTKSAAFDAADATLNMAL
jgi:hypothetical protein